MTATKETKPHPIERWIERSLPDYRFGLVLVLLLITFAFMASGVTGGCASHRRAPGSHAWQPSASQVTVGASGSLRS